MPWRGPEYPGEFATLGYQVADLIESTCVIPDGDHQGEPFILTDEQLRFLLWHYRIAHEHGRFTFRRSQLVRPQKWGKGPFSAAIVIVEGHPDGPVRFDGWNAAGEPVGKPWPTPLIQCTAVSGDQTENVWSSLVPMIELGDLGADIPDTGETRINLPGGGRITPVTSSARSRLGQRITFAVQDETHSWLEANGGLKLADTQRRNLAGMQGRSIETTNAWDPAENSVAQRTYESKVDDVFRDYPDPPPGSFRNKRERRKILKEVYRDSWWIDVDRIDSEVVELIELGEQAQAERFFGNRQTADADRAFELTRWKSLADPTQKIPKKAIVTLGFDGAKFDDSTGIVATDVKTGHQVVVGVWERPDNAEPGWQIDDADVDAAMTEAFEQWNVFRLYADPPYWEDQVAKWAGRWGEKRVISWWTHRERAMVFALRSFRQAMKEATLTHDGDIAYAAHIGNSRRRKSRVKDDKGRPLFTISKNRPGSPLKIDLAMAGCLSWEARLDAISAGALEVKRRRTASF